MVHNASTSMEKNVAITVNPLYEAADEDNREMDKSSNGALEACKRWVRGHGFQRHRVSPSMEKINVTIDSQREYTVSSESEHSFASGLAVTFKVRFSSGSVSSKLGSTRMN
jgi:hypothetical protein